VSLLQGISPTPFCAFASPASSFSLPSLSLADYCTYRGKKLTVEASGTLSKDVEAGAKLHLTVKYNSIIILREETDLCDQLPNVGLSCPLKKGPLDVTKEVEITSQVPEGKYIVIANVYTESHNEVITCMEGTAVFN
jgi:hypothetical protein